MNFNFALLKSIFFRPGAIAILLIVATISGAVTLSFCRTIRPRYSVAALFETAEFGAGKAESDPRESLFSGKGSSDIKLDALAFLEFEYLSGNRSANGVSLVDAKDQKSTTLIQLVAEGYTNESIELFLEGILRDLQTRYEPRMESAIARGQNQLEFINKEVLSLETFKIQVSTAIAQVGPSPVLGSQLMDINRDLTKLKQDYFAQKASMAPEKIHNFRLTSIRAMGGGAPVFPKSRPTVALAVFISMMLTGYIIFLFHLWRMRRSKKVVPEIPAKEAYLSAQKKPSEEPVDSKTVLANPVKTQFMANVSNELRSPLHNVLGMAGILLDTPLTDEQKEFTRSIQSSADNLLTLVNDLLTLRRDETRPSFAEISAFDIENLLKDVLENLPYVLTRFEKKVTYDIADEIRAMTLNGDRPRIEKILSSLTLNAIKFSRDNSAHVRVSIKNLNGSKAQLHFEVSDTGEGIPKATLERIFDAFEQEDMTPSRKFGGSGIGLTIAKRLVTALNGKIGVESILGLGSKFWFTIPVNFSQKQNVEPAGNAIPFEFPFQAGPTYRILLAEDNLVNQRVTVQMLKKFGHHVDVASDGNEALDALRLLPYDLILMDCQMPEMDGYEATRIIRSSKTIPQSNIPIIAVTASTSDFERGHCINVGMNNFLSKPFRADKLFDMIEDVMQANQRSA